VRGTEAHRQLRHLGIGIAALLESGEVWLNHRCSIYDSSPYAAP
jgi:hypothetical protein